MFLPPSRRATMGSTRRPGLPLFSGVSQAWRRPRARRSRSYRPGGGPSSRPGNPPRRGATALGESLGEGMAGTGGFLPHPTEDGIARFLPAGGPGVGFLEVDNSGEVSVEPAALGADDQHSAPPQSASAGDRVPVEVHPLLRGSDEHGSEHAAP